MAKKKRLVIEVQKLRSAEQIGQVNFCAHINIQAHDNTVENDACC
jgi:hypothetical protein